MTEKIKEEVKKSDDGLAAKVRKLEETIKNVVATLERQFGIDINKDGKVGLLAFLIAFSGLVAFAAPQSADTVWNVTDSTGTNDIIQVSKTGNLKVDGTVTAAGALSTGAIVSSGSVTATSLVSGSTVVPPVLLNTNANVVLTLQVPAASGQMLLAPNATNVYTTVGVGGDGVTNSYLLRLAVNIGGTTNGWVTVVTDNQ
jgi:hypothetical protein